MPIPEFIVELRRHVGHAPLWLIGCTAVVLRETADARDDHGPGHEVGSPGCDDDVLRPDAPGGDGHEAPGGPSAPAAGVPDAPGDPEAPGGLDAPAPGGHRVPGGDGPKSPGGHESPGGSDARGGPDAPDAPGGPDHALGNPASGTQVLLVRRADFDVWSPVTGIVDPGEDPHDSAVREVFEETRVRGCVESLVWVHATELMTHVNGDQARYLDLCFRLRYVGGEPQVGDDENLEARWWPLHALPPMPEHFAQRVAVAVADPARPLLGPQPWP